MTWIGIDPGLAGCIAVIHSLGQSVIPTPVQRVGKRREYLEAEMAQHLELIQKQHGPLRCAIENVHAMPGQGVVGMFRFGYGFGVWLGILAALQIPYDKVPPQRWQKAMLPAGKRTKGAAIVRAQQLFPELCVKRDGEADALLLAEFGRRHIR